MAEEVTNIIGDPYGKCFKITLREADKLLAVLKVFRDTDQIAPVPYRAVLNMPDAAARERDRMMAEIDGLRSLMLSKDTQIENLARGVRAITDERDATQRSLAKCLERMRNARSSAEECLNNLGD